MSDRLPTSHYPPPPSSLLSGGGGSAEWEIIRERYGVNVRPRIDREDRLPLRREAPWPETQTDDVAARRGGQPWGAEQKPPQVCHTNYDWAGDHQTTRRSLFVPLLAVLPSCVKPYTDGAR